jgi:hypothetical protein
MFYKAGIKVATRRTFGDVNAMSANTRQSGQWAGAGRELLCADDVSQTDGKRSADNTPYCGICRASQFLTAQPINHTGTGLTLKRVDEVTKCHAKNRTEGSAQNDLREHK